MVDAVFNSPSSSSIYDDNDMKVVVENKMNLNNLFVHHIGNDDDDNILADESLSFYDNDDNSTMLSFDDEERFFNEDLEPLNDNDWLVEEYNADLHNLVAVVTKDEDDATMKEHFNDTNSIKRGVVSDTKRSKEVSSKPKKIPPNKKKRANNFKNSNLAKNSSSCCTKRKQNLPQQRTIRMITTMPLRPLSSYNIFFRDERRRILDDEISSDEKSGVASKTISLNDLVKTIERRWNSISIHERKKYDTLSTIDIDRYRNEMKSYNDINNNSNNNNMDTTNKKTKISSRSSCRTPVANYHEKEKDKQSVGIKGNSYQYQHQKEQSTQRHKQQQRREAEFTDHRICCINNNNVLTTTQHDVGKKKKSSISLSANPITPCSEQQSSTMIKLHNNNKSKKGQHSYFVNDQKTLNIRKTARMMLQIKKNNKKSPASRLRNCEEQQQQQDTSLAIQRSLRNKNNVMNELKLPQSYNNNSISTTSYETINPIPYQKQLVVSDMMTTPWEHQQQESSSHPIMYHDGRHLSYNNQYSYNQYSNNSYNSYDSSYYYPYSNRQMLHDTNVASPVPTALTKVYDTANNLLMIDKSLKPQSYDTNMARPLYFDHHTEVNDDSYQNNDDHEVQQKRYYHKMMKPITEVLYAPIAKLNHVRNIIPPYAKEIDSKYIPTSLVKNNTAAKYPTCNVDYHTSYYDHHQQRHYRIKNKYYIMKRNDATNFITNLYQQKISSSSSFI